MRCNPDVNAGSVVWSFASCLKSSEDFCQAAVRVVPLRELRRRLPLSPWPLFWNTESYFPGISSGKWHLPAAISRLFRMRIIFKSVASLRRHGKTNRPETECPWKPGGFFTSDLIPLAATFVIPHCLVLRLAVSLFPFFPSRLFNALLDDFFVVGVFVGLMITLISGDRFF